MNEKIWKPRVLDCRSHGSRRLSIARENRAAGRLPSGITALLFVISNPTVILYIQSLTYCGGVGCGANPQMLILGS